jgi:hypothetical protein
MTRRAFDTRGNLADQLFRSLETPYSDVLKHSAVPATRQNGPQGTLRGPFSCPMVTLLVTSFAGAWSRELGLRAIAGLRPTPDQLLIGEIGLAAWRWRSTAPGGGRGVQMASALLGGRGRCWSLPSAAESNTVITRRDLAIAVIVSREER